MAADRLRVGAAPTGVGDGATIVVSRWDGYIRTLGRQLGYRHGLGRADIDDAAQDARVRLAEIADDPRCAFPAFVKAVVRNALVNSIARRRWDVPFPDHQLEQRAVGACSQSAPEAVAIVRGLHVWLDAIPGTLRRVYDALYVAGLTQREAALDIGVSQPRIAQLHRELLERGRERLGP